MVKKIILIIFIIICNKISAGELWLSDETKGEYLIIKMVNFGPGDKFFSWWGHGGIIIEDTTLQQAKIYNFGMVKRSHFRIVKFILGTLKYWVGEFPDSTYLEKFVETNRDVIIRTLHILPEKRLEMANSLVTNVLPENKYYKYHQYKDNCSTRMRDIIDKAVFGELFRSTNEPTEMTFREHTERYLGHITLIKLFLLYLMGDYTDQKITKWDEMFLPDMLAKHVDSLHYQVSDGKKYKLVSDNKTLFLANREPVSTKKSNHLFNTLFYGIIVGLFSIIIVLLKKYSSYSALQYIYSIYTILIGLLLGLAGLLLTFFSTLTDLDFSYYNENLIFTNPFTLILVFTGWCIFNNKMELLVWQKWIWTIHLLLLTSAALLKFLPSFDQDNTLIFAFLTPIYVLNTLAVWMISD